MSVYIGDRVDRKGVGHKTHLMVVWVIDIVNVLPCSGFSGFFGFAIKSKKLTYICPSRQFSSKRLE